MKTWERPTPRLLAIFFFLGLFAWWTFRTVSLPPLVRSLFEEDQAMATAATPATAGERFQQERNKLPPPPQEHDPKVAALIQRLRSIPAVPYLLQVALQRDAATPKGETPQAWNEAEVQALRETQAAYLNAWEPFLSGPAPDWARYPDSVRLFRSTFFLLRENQTAADLATYQPGQSGQRSLVSDPWENPEFFISLVKQVRRLGAIRLPQARGNTTDTIGVAKLTCDGLQNFLSSPEISLSTLEGIRTAMASAPDLAEIQSGLAADRALFSRAADYLENLPPSTSAKAGLARWWEQDKDTAWILAAEEKPAFARDLGSGFRRDAAQLETLRQKTFLPGPGWRQWLSGDPGTGLAPLLAQGIDGFREFENTRATYLLTQAALDARIAIEKNGLEAARQIPDPTVPGTFLQVEKTDEGIRISSSLVPKGETNPVSFLVPPPPGPSP